MGCLGSVRVIQKREELLLFFIGENVSFLLKDVVGNEVLFEFAGECYVQRKLYGKPWRGGEYSA